MTLLTDAFTAYLGPLLKKHAAGEALVWEDLEASRAASMEVMKSSDNAFVSKKIEDLHQTQVQAYREAAVKALRGWAQSEAPLEPMEENDTEDSFVERCVNAASSSWPNWRLDSAKMVVIIEIRKRARATYAKYHPAEDDMADDTPAAKVNGAAKPNASNAASNDDENNEEEEEDDDGEVEEDGEMDDDGEEDGQAASSEPSASKKSAGNEPKAKATTNSTTKNKKKVTVRKKSTNAKGGQQRNKGPAIRGRRTGRGGGKAGASKSG